MLYVVCAACDVRVVCTMCNDVLRCIAHAACIVCCCCVVGDVYCVNTMDRFGVCTICVVCAVNIVCVIRIVHNVLLYV